LESKGERQMPTPIAQQYAATIRDQTRFFATWPPNAAVAIGDHGPMDGALFERFSNLGGLKSTQGPAKAGFDIQIGAQRGLNFDANARAQYQLTEGQALLEIGFSTASGVMFSTEDAQVTRTDDIGALGRQLASLHDEGKWDLSHGIVIELISVPKATILASQSVGAQAKFSVDGKTPVTASAMANLKADASMLLSKGVGVKIVGEGPLTPLFRLAFLCTHVFRPPDIQYRGVLDTPQEIAEISDKHDLAVY
jgi:hypothetical protein